MPWIKVIREHEADTELKEVYEKIAHQRRGEQINQERTNGGNSPIIARSEPEGYVAYSRVDVGDYEG